MTPSAKAYIDYLRECVANMPNMRVVDYLGRVDQAPDGTFYKVDENTNHAARYGIRSLRHIEAYNLTILED